jgi:hypothetical protein
MSDQVKAFIGRQLSQLRSERVALDRRLTEVNAKIDELERAANAIGMVNGLGESSRPKRGVLREGTIKDFVVKVLADHPEGLVALDILAQINARFGTKYPRTSLSPQLSRLGREGVLGRRGVVWYLKTQQDGGAGYAT